MFLDRVKELFEPMVLRGKKTGFCSLSMHAVSWETDLQVPTLGDFTVKKTKQKQKQKKTKEKTSPQNGKGRSAFNWKSMIRSRDDMWYAAENHNMSNVYKTVFRF